MTLARDGFYDGTRCHRLTVPDPMYVLQCGEPTGRAREDLTGGSGRFENARPTTSTQPVRWPWHEAETPQHGQSFFMVYRDSTIPTDTAGGYTVLGSIVGGLDVLRATVASGRWPAGTTDTR